MDHRRLIPQARRIKQIVLWMGVIRLTMARFAQNGSRAWRNKIKVDRWRLNV
jgi:hypothetical protein